MIFHDDTPDDVMAFVHGLEAERNELRAHLTEAQAENERLLALARRLDKANDYESAIAKSALSAVLSLSRQLSDLRAENAALIETMNTIREQREAYQSQLSNLQERLKGLEENRAMWSEVYASLQASCADVATQLRASGLPSMALLAEQISPAPPSGAATPPEHPERAGATIKADHVTGVGNQTPPPAFPSGDGR